MVGLEIGSGRDVWTADAKGPIDGGFAADSHALFVANTGGRVSAFSLSDGTLIWARAAKGPAFSVPTVVGKRLIIGFRPDARGVGLLALETQNGEPVWTASNARGFLIGDGEVDISLAFRADQRFYAASGSNRVAAINLKSGEVLWSTTAGTCMRS